MEGLCDRSRRPRSSSGWTPAVMESAVLHLRDKHPAWSGRKIRHRLLALGHQGVPEASIHEGARYTNRCRAKRSILKILTVGQQIDYHLNPFRLIR